MILSLPAIQLCNHASEILMSSEPTLAPTPNPKAPPGNIPLVHRVWRILGARFRQRRVADFLKTFAVTPQTRILDVGGTRVFWQGMPVEVTTVNLDPSNSDYVADARDLPFPDGSFDIVFSNSLIEYVGSFEDQLACAREITRVGIRYYVQTPNKWFPIEPHFIAPFIHWIPPRLRRILARLTVWAILTRPNQQTIDEFIASIRLLTSKEVRQLFPDAQLKAERFCGLKKSLIAQRL